MNWYQYISKSRKNKKVKEKEKKVERWCIYTMEYYSAIKKNSFESVLMRWMKLEPIIQSEISQKDIYQYSILMHTYGICNDNSICRTEKETQMYRTDF